MKRSSTIVATAFAAALVIACAIVAFVVYTSGVPQKTDIQNNGFEQLDEGWTVANAAEGGTGIALPSVFKLDAGAEAVVMSKQLSYTGLDNAMLMVKTGHSEVNAFIDGIKLQPSATSAPDVFGTVVISTWTSFDIPSEVTDATLELWISEPQNKSYIEVSRAFVGEETPILLNLVFEDIGLCVASLFMLILAVTLCILAFLISKVNKSRIPSALVSLALFIILVNVWMLCDSEMIRMAFSDYNALYYASFFTFTLMPVPLLFFIENALQKKRRVLMVLAGLFIALFFLNTVLMAGGIVPLTKTLVLVHVLLAVTVVLVVIVCCVDFFKNKNRDMVGVLWGFGVLGASCLIALVMFNFHPAMHYSTILFWGMALFIAVLGIGSILSGVTTMHRFRAIEELTRGIPCGICAVRLDGNNTLTYINDYAYRLFGYEKNTLPELAALRAQDFVYPEDNHFLAAKFEEQRALEVEQFELEVRGVTKNGDLIWLMLCCARAQRIDEVIIAVFDITDRKEMETRLKVSEEEYRLAVKHSDQYILRYELVADRLFQQEDNKAFVELPNVIEDASVAILNSRYVAEESKREFKAFCDSMQQGNQSGSAVLAHLDAAGKPLWYRCDFTEVYDTGGLAVHAVISLTDISDKYEKEQAFKKWRQTLDTTPPEEMSYFEFNLTDDVLEHEEGLLIPALPEAIAHTLTAFVNFVSATGVFSQDNQAFKDFFDRDKLLEDYKNEEYLSMLEFRRISGEGEMLWTRASVQLTPDPFVGDIKCSILFEDIDREKKEELHLQAMAQEDPLTGLLNRAAFVGQFELLLSQGPTQGQHALVILDIDGFKDVNDTFGHGFGDKVLVGIAHDIKTALRAYDLIGRLGGDEFVICLKDIPLADVLKRKLALICKTVRHRYSKNVAISASIGVALAPQDGSDFETLYKNADRALYCAKKTGKNRYMLYNPKIDDEGWLEEMQSSDYLDSGGLDRVVHVPAIDEAAVHTRDSRKTMLIVDDMKINRDILRAGMREDFDIIEAVDGKEALDLLDRYGGTIAAVLLDLLMPGMSGLEVLEAMQGDAFLETIPVIVISATDEVNQGMRAIEMGASGFVTKPVEMKLLKAHVQNSINRREHDELQAQNRYMLVQKDESDRYVNVLETTRSVLFEYDPKAKAFDYESLIFNCIAGTYDDRDLWTVFKEDGVASSERVDEMRSFMEKTIDDPLITMNHMDCRLRTVEGDISWFRFNLSKKVGEGGGLYKVLLTFTDINAEVEYQDEMRTLMEFNAVTGIYSKETFYRMTKDLLEADAQTEFLIARFDIESFKVINDMFGYDEGDRLLRYVADQLKAYMEGKGTYGHLGSDNFAFCTAYSDECLEQISSGKLLALEDYDLPFEIIVSYGLYRVAERHLPVDSMLDRAGLAQHTVKGKYLKRYAFYDAALREDLLNAQQIINDMNRALENDEFEVYLQPKCDLDTQKIVGAEALTRWNHPTRGVLMPSEFIPIFEKNGFIIKFDQYMWEKVCQLLHKWLVEGKQTIPIAISANISRVNIYNPDLCKTLLGLVRRYDIPTKLFELEITESAYADNPQLLKDVMEELRMDGFIMEMDDFGSGYSSLNMLKDIPVDVLKIDMEFLFDFDAEGRGRSVLRSVVEMAKELGLVVIAEGVETDEQAEFLRSIGCHQAQGYLYYCPMPISEFEQLIN